MVVAWPTKFLTIYIDFSTTIFVYILLFQRKYQFGCWNCGVWQKKTDTTVFDNLNPKIDKIL